MENDKQTTKQTFIKVYRYGRFDLTYAIKQELKFRGRIAGVLALDIATNVVRGTFALEPKWHDSVLE